MTTRRQMEAFAHRKALPTRHEHNLMAADLSEYFNKIEFDHSVAFIDDDIPD
jgi:hypothetical protein